MPYSIFIFSDFITVIIETYTILECKSYLKIVQFNPTCEKMDTFERMYFFVLFYCKLQQAQIQKTT